MSSTITLKVASLTSVVTSAKSDADTGQILRWFVQDWASPPPDGLNASQTNQYYLDQAAARVAQMIRQEAARVRMRELAAQVQAVQDGAVADTQL